MRLEVTLVQEEAILCLLIRLLWAEEEEEILAPLACTVDPEEEEETTADLADQASELTPVAVKALLAQTELESHLPARVVARAETLVQQRAVWAYLLASRVVQ